MGRLCCFLVVAYVLGTLAHALQTSTRATLFEGARLITGDGGAPVENSA